MQPGGGEALAAARRALAVVRVLQRRPLGVRSGRLGREAGLAEAELGPLLSMLCEEEYAYRSGVGVYAPGRPSTGSRPRAAGAWRPSCSARWPWRGTAPARPCT